jgi:hypothetical protein
MSGGRAGTGGDSAREIRMNETFCTIVCFVCIFIDVGR